MDGMNRYDISSDMKRVLTAPAVELRRNAEFDVVGSVRRDR
jgi:hypothetical protein